MNETNSKLLHRTFGMIFGISKSAILKTEAENKNQTITTASLIFNKSILEWVSRINVPVVISYPKENTIKFNIYWTRFLYEVVVRINDVSKIYFILSPMYKWLLVRINLILFQWVIHKYSMTIFFLFNLYINMNSITKIKKRFR